MLSFRCENGTATLVGLEEGFLLYRFGWDENGVNAFTLESYDAGGLLLHSRDLKEGMEIYRTANGVLFLGHDSHGIYRYDPSDFSLTQVDSVPEGWRICGFQRRSHLLPRKDRRDPPLQLPPVFFGARPLVAFAKFAGACLCVKGRCGHGQKQK